MNPTINLHDVVAYFSTFPIPFIWEGSKMECLIVFGCWLGVVGDEVGVSFEIRFYYQYY